MRISIKAGLAFAGAAAAVAAAGGAAYAAGDDEPEPIVQIVTEQEQGISGDTRHQWSRDECPDQTGTASTRPGVDQADVPGTPHEPTAPREAL
ncbi:hypothetical protein [Micromonospora sp. NPDC005220]|uniref:hypothetical protein n=1 Tax=Micromonospora sp. NPDC005220 TaxID=3155589 RepID=UPI0033AD5021